MGTCPNPIATFTENPSTEPFAAANFPAQTKSRATFHRKPATTDSAAPQGKYVAEIHVDLEGREVARATAPFMGEQLAWEG